MLCRLFSWPQNDVHPLSGIQVSLRVFSCASELYFKYAFFLISSRVKKIITRSPEDHAEIFFGKTSFFFFPFSFFLFHTSYFLFHTSYLTKPFERVTQPFERVSVLYNTFLYWRWLREELCRLSLCVKGMLSSLRSYQEGAEKGTIYKPFSKPLKPLPNPLKAFRTLSKGF